MRFGMRERRYYKNAGGWIASCVLTMMLALLLKNKIHIYSCVYIGVAILVYNIMMIFFLRRFGKSEGWLEGFICGYLFMSAFLIGIVLEDSKLTFVNVLTVLITSVLGGMFGGNFYPVFIRIFNCFPLSNKKFVFEKHDKKVYLCYVSVLFLLWLPVLLAYYPGIFGYDVDTQIWQSINNAHSTHHPLLHTIILYWFYQVGGWLGNRSIGLVIYTIIQMLLLSMALSFLVLFMRRSGVYRKWRVLLLIFMGIIPFFPVLSISMTKDIAFTSFFTIVCTIMSYWSIQPELIYEKKYLGLFLTTVLGMCFFRNNGIYIVIICTIGLVLRLRQKYTKQLLIYHIGIIFIFIFLNSLLTNFMEAEKGSINEMLSVPYQQIANTYYYESEYLDEDTVEKIKRIIPDIEMYRSDISDPIKMHGTAAENQRAFLELYVNLFKKYPMHYIEGFLRVTQGYWYIDDITASKIYGEILEARQGYLLTDTKSGYEVYHTSYIEPLEIFYEKMFSANEYRNFPIISCMFSLAVYFWLIILATVHVIFNKKWSISMPFVLTWGLILTILMGPCALVRYAFPYIVVTPLLLVISFWK